MDNKQEDSKNFGIYLLPNLFTTAAIFSGFYAIVSAMNGSFSSAAIAIFIAALLDSLDGRVARMTNTQSKFGAEYDSLADIVSFGVAPALIIYTWALLPLGQVGWLVAFLFVACNALRLAKFNANLGKGDKRYFYGLPVPAAACLIAGIVWVGHKYEASGSGVGFSILIAIVALYLAAMMVSNVKYRSFKDFDVKGKVGFTSVVFVVLIFACIALDPAHVLFFIFGLYALSGPFVHVWSLAKGDKDNHGCKKPDEDHLHQDQGVNEDLKQENSENTSN